MKIMASSPITSGQIDGETMETVTDFIFLGFKITADGDCSHEIKPDILEGEVKWALGSIITNKASGGGEISVELFQILKDDAVKVLYSICQEIWKIQQWSKDWKRSAFIPSTKKAMPKNVQNTTQLHSSHILAK